MHKTGAVRLVFDVKYFILFMFLFLLLTEVLDNHSATNSLDDSRAFFSSLLVFTNGVETKSLSNRVAPLPPPWMWLLSSSTSSVCHIKNQQLKVCWTWLSLINLFPHVLTNWLIRASTTGVFCFCCQLLTSDVDFVDCSLYINFPPLPLALLKGLLVQLRPLMLELMRLQCVEWFTLNWNREAVFSSSLRGNNMERVRMHVASTTAWLQGRSVLIWGGWLKLTMLLFFKGILN